MRFSPRIITIVVTAGALLSLALSAYLIPRALSDSQAPQAQEKTNSGLPLRLKIPKINVDAAVVYVDLTPDGAMGAPKTQADVAWYQPGVRPGENGSAVIAGHYGWIKGKPSVFNDAYTLRKGDKIYVEDDKGNVVSFVVRESREYDPKADTLNVFSSTDGKSHLNLITCEGEWDEANKTYSGRLVIFADKE